MSAETEPPRPRTPRPLERLDEALAVAAKHGGWSRFEVAPDGTVKVYSHDVPAEAVDPFEEWARGREARRD